MKVFVTGSNGFLGSHIVKILHEKGYEIRAFVLTRTPKETLAGIPCEIFEGDLLNESDVAAALTGCDYVIHTAGITDVWPTKNPLSWKINLDLVKQMVRLAKEKNIKKFIHVGTANSFGFGTKEKPGNESTPFNCGKYGLDYIESKKATQDFLLNEAKEEFPVVIINPTFMIGENDTKPGSGELIISVMKHKVPAYAAGGRCFAAVKDVAAACVSALEKGKVGECYITGGTNLCYKEFFAMIGKISGVKPPKMRSPKGFSMFLGSMIETFANLRHKKPRLTKTMAMISADGHYYSSDKAKAELGYVQTDIETALKEAIAWYRKHGYVQ